MEQVKKVLLMHIPMSICNFRCHYCYLAQRSSQYEGIQPVIKYTPEQIAAALSPRRLGGPAFMNFCAEGETLLTKNLDTYIKPLLEQGHYIEIVTNLSVTPVLRRFLAFDRELLKHLEFKCSFHFLELKKRNLLDIFAENVKSVWAAGASANIEITPSDELIPYIDEVKEVSMKNFGALPHLTIARNDRVKTISYLTDLPMEEYDRVWSQFDSDFWKYKRSIFGEKRTEFCYAGLWSAYVNFATGEAKQCYMGERIGNVFEDPEAPFPGRAVGRCGLPHCYNGHALMTLGLIPGQTEMGYGDIRDRERSDGTHWLREDLKAFFNTKLCNSNEQLSAAGRVGTLARTASYRAVRRTKNSVKRAAKSIAKKD